ncbi:MAG: FAD-binding protein [Oscillospiraceae bacterium]
MELSVHGQRCHRPLRQQLRLVHHQRQGALRRRAVWLQVRGRRQVQDPCATSIEGLAKKMGCDPATLQATYDRYCELVEKGVDEDFGKPAEFLHPIKGPKFVALRMHPCVTVTFGGLETDVSARVMKPDGSVIPHLYAAGEVAGTGMYGTQYPTCGTSIGSALFYGRIAGRAVTDQALL